MKRFDNDGPWRAGNNNSLIMKCVRVGAWDLGLLWSLAFGAWCFAFSPAEGFAAEEGVAVAIIYDTSGSMREPVRDSAGNRTPKYVIANRALISIAKQIQAFATNAASGTPRRIDAGLFIFNGNSAQQAIKFGPFNAAVFQRWANDFSSPEGNTP